MNDYTLTLTFRCNYSGETKSMAVEVPDIFDEKIIEIKPPNPLLCISFDELITVMRRREFRKSLFMRHATNLGALLAERMEDAEGWNGNHRMEPAQEELRKHK